VLQSINRKCTVIWSLRVWPWGLFKEVVCVAAKNGAFPGDCYAASAFAGGVFAFPDSLFGEQSSYGVILATAFINFGGLIFIGVVFYRTHYRCGLETGAALRLCWPRL